jgi:hypothetical protein
VEEKLQKFRDEKILHEIKAVKLKQIEEEKERYVEAKEFEDTLGHGSNH